MRKSLLKLYAPFLALALLQAAFIAFAPSKGPNNQFAGGTFGEDGGSGLTGQQGGGASSTGADGTGGSGGSGSGGSGSGGSGGGGSGGSGGGSGGGTTAGGGGTTEGGGATGGGGTATGPAGPAGPVDTSMDRSICKGDFQFNLLHVNPGCVGRWTGDNNGGQTYQGVSGTEVKVIIFQGVPNPAVDTILASQGLAQSPEQTRNMDEAISRFINKHYELYGRKIVLERIQGDCQTSPPDYAKCRQAAQQIIKKKPFLVLWGTPLYASIFQDFAQAGIITVGGWHFDVGYFNNLRPFRYDLVMDGTQSADVLAEYYCKNLAKGKNTHSGPFIHESYPGRGARGTMARKLAVITPGIEANVLTGKRVMSLVRNCGGKTHNSVITYESNIETADAQAQGTTEKLIDAEVTTVLCMCDPIAPAVGSKYYTKNNFFPEIFTSGMGFSDYDKVGRLYDANQMRHAFGVSQLAEPFPFDDQDHNRVWRDSGMDKETGDRNACQSCGLNWAYGGLVANMIMRAGPTLNPFTVERGTLTSPGFGGSAQIPFLKFGPDDYTAVSDVRLTYWSATAQSRIDGNPGAYVSLDNGKRYQRGQIPGNTMSKVPVNPD